MEIVLDISFLGEHGCSLMPILGKNSVFAAMARWLFALA